MLGGLAAALAGPGGALAQGRGYGPIEVDTSPLAARGLPNYAVKVRAAALAAAAQEFGSLTGTKGGPRIILRIDRVSIYGRTGRNAWEASDEISGAVVIRDGSGVRTVPIRTSQWANGPDLTLDPNSENRRLFELCLTFAGWARRAI
jgi:hypothetical protein